jgi:hypothetical protein
MKVIRWMMIPLVAGVFSASCERPEETAREELSIAAREDPGYETEAPVDIHAVPDTAGGRTLMGNLAEMRNSGVRGVVTFTPADGQSQIHLSITGVQPNTLAVTTIERGTCQQVGVVVEQLDAIQVEETGVATATITLDRTIESFADGQHSIRVYPEQGMQAPPVSCSEIPRTAAPTAM